MGWVNWSRKNDDRFVASTGTLGLDVNATRVRAMAAETGRPPRAILLDEPHAELHLAVSLEKRVPAVGRPALALERRLPHLACFNFLNALTQPLEWKASRHRYDAAGLVSLAIERIRSLCPQPENLTLVLPTYLNAAKVNLLAHLFDKVKMPIRGSVVTPLALVSAWNASICRSAITLIVDVDDHALSGALVSCESGEARILGSIMQPRLGQRVWKDRLLNALADRCIRVCRRDPRDSATAEQALFEQIDDALERMHNGQKVDMTIRSTHWYQNLIQYQDDFDGYCEALAKQAVATLRDLLLSSPEPPQAVWFTHAAGRLPGLTERLHEQLAERTTVNVLPVDAGAQAAVTLATRWVRDELPRTHLDSAVLLPEAGGGDSRLIPRDGKAAVRSRRQDS